MRFAATSALLALPLLAASEGTFFDRAQDRLQTWLAGLKVPGSNTPGGAVPAASIPKTKTKSNAKSMEVLTLNNWNQTLFSPVKPGATKPEEWWVLITGGNKTCFGRCAKAEAAFNETAAKFATLPKAPHTAYLNCENEDLLCNMWSAPTGTIWIFDMLPPPAEIPIHIHRMNLTSATSQELLDLYASGKREDLWAHEGYFHPYNGIVAKYGIGMPVAYALWFFNAVPSWAVMLVVSFASRTLMNRGFGGGNRRQAGPGAAPAPAGAAL